VELLNKIDEMMKGLGSMAWLTEAVLKTIECPVRLGLGDKNSMVSLG
jgi:hypothetical protein